MNLKVGSAVLINFNEWMIYIYIFFFAHPYEIHKNWR